MSYRATARAYAIAEGHVPASVAMMTAQEAADALPLSDWAESHRADSTPVTVAANHALHVGGAAHEMRGALREFAYAVETKSIQPDDLARIQEAARALLAAIGEEENA